MWDLTRKRTKFQNTSKQRVLHETHERGNHERSMDNGKWMICTDCLNSFSNTYYLLFIQSVQQYQIGFCSSSFLLLVVRIFFLFPGQWFALLCAETHSNVLTTVRWWTMRWDRKNIRYGHAHSTTLVHNNNNGADRRRHTTLDRDTIFPSEFWWLHWLLNNEVGVVYASVWRRIIFFFYLC